MSASAGLRSRPFRAAPMIDRLCSAMVLLGACGHTAGSLAFYPAGSEVLVYALGVSVLGLSCAYLNLLRSFRPDDRPVAGAALLTSLGQAGVAIGWGFAIGDLLDQRVIGFTLFAGILAVFSAAECFTGAAEPGSGLRPDPLPEA